MNRNTLCYISCTKEKIWDIAPHLEGVQASCAYRNSDFILANNISEKLGGRIIIFSAKYGFLDPTDIIPGPYDITFSRKDDPVISMNDLHQQADQKKLLSYNDIHVFCSEPYHQRIKTIYNKEKIKIHNPILKASGFPEIYEILNTYNNTLRSRSGES